MSAVQHAMVTTQCAPIMHVHIETTLFRLRATERLVGLASSPGRGLGDEARLYEKIEWKSETSLKELLIPSYSSLLTVYRP